MTKNPDEMSVDELREELVKILASRKKNRWFGHSDRKERIAADPKAYFTKRKDYEQAERKDPDATKDVPKLNVNG